MIDLDLLRQGRGRIGVVAHSQAKLTELLNAFEGLGLQNVEQFSSFDAVLQVAHKNPVDWLFCTYIDEADVSLLTALDQFADLRGCAPYVSAVLTHRELIHLPEAFEKGLFSWHPDKGVAEYTRQSIWRLQRKMEEAPHLPVLIPYFYFRNYLKQKSMWTDLAHLCESMTTRYPYEDLLKLHHVEALIRLGDRTQGERLLAEVEFFDPSLSGQIAEMRKQILNNKPERHETLAKRYHALTAVLITPDQAEQVGIRSILNDFGFEDIRQYEGCKDAWADFREWTGQLDLLILDWDLNDGSSALLLQKIRLVCSYDTPIVVLARAFEKADHQLVRDLKVASTIIKTQPPRVMAMSLAWTLVQGKEPSESAGYERKVLERLNKVDLVRAKRYLDNYLKIASRSHARENFLLAAVAYQQHNFTQAKYLLMEAMTEARGRNLDIPVLLARCLMKLGDHQGALGPLKQVAQGSPKNISYFCLLADAYLRAGNYDQVEIFLSQAEALDAQHPILVKMETVAAMVNGKVERFESFAADQAVVAKAVPYVLSLAWYALDLGHVEQGHKVLKNSRHILGQRYPEWSAWVDFHLAMAYRHTGEYNLALRSLQDLTAAPVAEIAAWAKKVDQQWREEEYFADDWPVRFLVADCLEEAAMPLQCPQTGGVPAAEEGHKIELLLRGVYERQSLSVRGRRAS
jgi:tetratricopeptide (TPR) repeat protein